MKKDSFSAHLTNGKETANAVVSGSKSALKKARLLSADQFKKIVSEIEEKLDKGLSTAVQEQINSLLSGAKLSATEKAHLEGFLSLALEMKGLNQAALQTLVPYEDDSLLEEIDEEIAVSVLAQLALSYSNIGDYPKGVAILKIVLEQAEERNFTHLFGKINVSLARVYRKLKEYEISRDFAEKGLKYYRDYGDWRGMSQAYYNIASSYLIEGKGENAIEYFQQVIKLIGDRRFPFLLGITYGDLAAAYWMMRRPREGVECLTKSIEFFQKTEHKTHALSAYNNLGYNLLMLGEWKRSEEAIRHAIALGEEIDSQHRSMLYDSLGELLMLRGDFTEAEELQKKATLLAQETKRDVYLVQALQNSARCCLMQGKFEAAKETAEASVKVGIRLGDGQWRGTTHLILAECLLRTGDVAVCEELLNELDIIETASDLALSGSYQRVRGLCALSKKDAELAAHHFSRSLSIFETAYDAHRCARAQYEIGLALKDSQTEKAVRHITKALEDARRLGARPLIKLAEKALTETQTRQPVKKQDTPASLQLLFMRLAEAVASRELLFRELSAVLQQETRAKKIVILEQDENHRLVPAFSSGFTPSEGNEIGAGIARATQSDELEKYAGEKNYAIFQLRAPNAPLASLVVYPRSATVTLEGNSIQPFLRIVELGMDICALRDRDKTVKTDNDAGSMIPQTMLPGFIHSSPAMASLVEEIYKIRSSDVTVLVTGDSGTGKELVSRAIHVLSARKDKAFIPFNCTAVPKELAEGHLFGYKKGAFTGAVNDSPGVIRSAADGTLFLDEVGDLPLEVQPKLLRFLQEGEIQPLGEQKPIHLDVRVIAATNVPLEEKVENGTFREDLYYRLNVIRLRVPPLRERRSEIPPMVNYYMGHYSAKFGRRDLTITPQAMDLLMVCEWEGNVRQLCNEVQRLVARASDGETITPAHLSSDLKRSAAPIALPEGGNVTSIRSFSTGLNHSFNIETQGATLESAVTDLERKMILESLQRHSGNISRVARELGLTRRGLYLKLERYQLSKIA
jgi:transcriptional regulator with PAS, ATPase and Fis domain